MLYRLKGANDPSGCFVPKISSVFGFGVAVNANIESHYGEDVRPIELAQLLVQPTRRPEVGELELAPRIFDPVAENIEGPASLDLVRQTPQESLFHVLPVVLLQPPPLLRLRGEDEVEHILWDQAEVLVVICARPAVIAARDELAIAGCWFRNLSCWSPTGLSRDKYIDDGFFKGTLRNFRTHASVPSFRIAK
jgi:hypothetical protein